MKRCLSLRYLFFLFLSCCFCGFMFYPLNSDIEMNHASLKYGYSAETKTLDLYFNGYQGLGNRLKYLVSYVRYYKPQNLKIHWPNRGWVKARFSDLFILDLPIKITENNALIEMTKSRTDKANPLFKYVNTWGLIVAKTDYSHGETPKSIDFEYKNIAVLYRTNAQSRNVEEFLLKENISYKVVGSFYFYNRKEIKDLIAYLKLIHNEKDDVSLLRVINYPKRGIGTKTIEELTIISNEKNCSLYDAIESGKELEFKNIIEDLKKESEKMSLTEFIDLVLDKTGIRPSLKSERTLEADIRLENLEEFKSITRTVEEVDGIASLGDFLDEISLVTDASEKQEDNGEKVTLMTMHAVKGLEFDYVFVIGVEEGLFPHLNSMNSEDELEEERRLCYVAITRARKKLYIINARSRLLYGKVSSNVPSRFISEIGDDLLDQEKKESLFVNKKINREDMVVDNDIKPGDLIEHDKYGKGVVMDIDGSIATIAFSKTGVKKLLKNHKAIKKVGI